MKNTIVQLIKTGLINSGRARAREELLRMSDKTLEDAGFSRALLLQGNKAWPWRTTSDQPNESSTGAAATSMIETPAEQTPEGQASVVEQPAVSSTRNKRRAIRELQAMSDAELDDIGVARGQIKQVVEHGRVGYERSDHQSAA